MPDCEYCHMSFDDGDAYLDHLAAVHADDLGPIDRRRVRAREADDGADWTRPAVLVAGLAVLAGLALVVSGSGLLGGSDAGGPYDYGAVHEHGTMVVVIDGERVDFSQPRYQVQETGDRFFHFEGGNGRVWHVHGRGVTLAYAMETLGIQVTGDSLTYGGTTYRDGDPGTNVSVRVNGEPVDPEEYVLDGEPVENAEQGDAVRIEVTVDS